MTATTHTITLEGMRFHAFHGVMPLERTVGNEFEVTVRLQCRILPQAWDGDDLAGTINYAQIHALVETEMSKPSNLLENVAHRIAKTIIGAFGGSEAPCVVGGEVEVAKFAPPFKSRISKVVVSHHFTAEGLK